MAQQFTSIGKKRDESLVTVVPCATELHTVVDNVDVDDDDGVIVFAEVSPTACGATIFHRRTRNRCKLREERPLLCNLPAR